jgi:hypothetical protein
MAMKAAKITVVLLLILTSMIWVRFGQDLGHLARTIPFCSGNPPSLYDFGALALVIMCFLALRRLKHAQVAEPEAPDNRHDANDSQPPQP